MIRIGCANARPEDVSLLSSGEVATLLLSRDFLIEPPSDTPDEPSVDVLFVDADKMNKLNSVVDLRSRPWVLLSSNKTDAWRAWSMGATYFLLRPYTLQDLERALERVEQCHYWKQQRLPRHFQHRQLELQLTKGRKAPVRHSDILFLEAQGEVTGVYLNLPGPEKLMATRNLGFWEQQLDEAFFVRIHKKYLVNVAYVSALLPDAVSVQGFRLPVAKRRRKEVEKALFDHQMQYRAKSLQPFSDTGKLPVVKKN